MFWSSTEDADLFMQWAEFWAITAIAAGESPKPLSELMMQVSLIPEERA